MDSDTVEFEYETLTCVPPHIRLLSLVSLSPGRPCFRLQTVQLDKAPPYAALSYHWGNPIAKNDIVVNGKKAKITDNLMKALKATFRTKRDGSIFFSAQPGRDQDLLWADAICINQVDVLEKSSQVPLMAEIYTRARLTVGYVGFPLDGEDPNQALVGLAAICSPVFVESYPGSSNEPRWRDSRSGNSDEWKLRMNSFWRFWSSPWFTRCWVTQEVVLSRDIICLYGNERDSTTISLDVLGLLFNQLEHQGSEHMTAVRSRLGNTDILWQSDGMPLVHVASWLRLREAMRQSPNGINLVRLLQLTRHAQASDGRDKIYSLLGLMEKLDQNHITVDYSPGHSAEKAFTDLAKHCIASSNCMEMIACCSNSGKQSLPSWVPDWTTASMVPFDYQLYKAAGNTPLKMAEPCVSEDGKELTIRAMLFDTISMISPGAVAFIAASASGVIQGIEFPASVTVIMAEVAASLFASIMQGKFGRLLGQGASQGAIWRTLTADRAHNNRRLQPPDYRFYDSVLRCSCRQMSKESPSQDHSPDCRTFFSRVLQRSGGRAVFATEAGRIGIGPHNIKHGDRIAIFPGSNLPFILRCHRKDTYQLVGPCYVDESMDGEILQQYRNTVHKDFVSDINCVGGFEKVVLV